MLVIIYSNCKGLKSNFKIIVYDLYYSVCTLFYIFVIIISSFPENTYEFSVPEDAQPGTVIGQIQVDRLIDRQIIDSLIDI